MATLSKSNVITLLLLAFTSLYLKSVSTCSPNVNQPFRNITELAILAPVVVVATVLNTSVDGNVNGQIFSQYSACLNVTEIIKQEKSTIIPQIFCTEKFGEESMCLSQVKSNYSYVFYLDSNLKAKYETPFSAVRRATAFVILLAKKGYCKVDNVSKCVPPNVTGIPNKDVTVDEGEHLVLSCQASGTSPLVFTWSYKGDGGHMPHPSYTANDGSLHIDHVTASARGRYTCEVRNVAGSAKYETNVDVRMKRCGGAVMVNEKIHILSPNFPHQYSSDKTCVWRLCPGYSYRLKFHFNVFRLHYLDSLRIDNECDHSRSAWRKYCGNVSPGVFVSKCKSTCVQLRLMSTVKWHDGVSFQGMNFTVESTRERRTKKFDVLHYYCSSDLVIKGRYITHNHFPFNNGEMFAIESFKQPYGFNTSYDIILNDEDIYGCFRHFNFANDHIYFASASVYSTFTLNVAVPDDDSKESAYVKSSLAKYKNKHSICVPPIPPVP